MTEFFQDWQVSDEAQPKPDAYGFDLDRALSSVVALEARVPADAFTAESLGTERTGNGVLIRDDGLVLTIGYLITEAESVTLTTRDGRQVPAHVLGFDQASGFGLVQALEPLGVPSLRLGDSRGVDRGDQVIVAAAGGPARSVAGQVVARQEFAGYWEYVLDDALFTAPGHPLWSGAAVIGTSGELIGVGSLQLGHELPDGRVAPLNMVVPIELLHPILDDLITGGAGRPARPWLGLFAQEVAGQVVIFGFAGDRGPAVDAGLEEGDIVLAVAGENVTDLADFYRRVWALGPAGVNVPLRVERDGRKVDVRLRSVDRRDVLRKPRYH
jgi:S1-C subfamily serine protease